MIKLGTKPVKKHSTSLTINIDSNSSKYCSVPSSCLTQQTVPPASGTRQPGAHHTTKKRHSNKQQVQLPATKITLKSQHTYKYNFIFFHTVLISLLFFSIFINLGISYLHFNCYSLSRFQGQNPHNPSHSPSIWVFPSPSSPHYDPPPNNHIHWGFSLGRTKGFPFHWCSY